MKSRLALKYLSASLFLYKKSKNIKKCLKKPEKAEKYIKMSANVKRCINMSKNVEKGCKTPRFIGKLRSG